MRTSTVIVEIFKWGIVIYLLLPLHNVISQSGPINFARVALGVTLLVIFTGKMFYDDLFRIYKKSKEKSAAADLVSTLALVVIIAMVVGLAVLVLALFVVSYMQSGMNE